MSQFLDQLELYFSQGGFIMWPLVAATLVLWYSLGYRFLTLQRGTYDTVYALIDAYLAGARKGEPKGVIDQACRTGVRIMQRSRDQLRPVLDDAFHDLSCELRQGKSIISSVVSAAPLLGLLGTVTGMVETFDSLADMSFYSQSGGIAGGIAEALFTTQMGLVVAVPGVIIGRLLDRRQGTLEDELDLIKDVLCMRQASQQHEMSA